MKTTITPRRLHLSIPLNAGAIELSDVREVLATVVARADMDITGDQMRAAYDDAVRPYNWLQQEPEPQLAAPPPAPLPEEEHERLRAQWERC